MIGYFEDYDKRKHKLLCKKLINTGCHTHFHSEIELSYIFSGTHKITISGEEMTLQRGDIYICNPYELHKCRSDNAGEHILFTIRPFEYEQFPNLLKISFPNFLQNKVYNREICALLQDIIAKQNELNSLERQGYIGLILGGILHKYGQRQSKADSTRRFENVLLYLDLHYKEPIDRNSLAKEFGYSPTYFSRLFHENFHCGLWEYLNNLRYERTIEEISLSNGNKTDIILNNGFNNVQSFYRINRKRKTEYDDLKEFHSNSGKI